MLIIKSRRTARLFWHDHPSSYILFLDDFLYQRLQQKRVPVAITMYFIRRIYLGISVSMATEKKQVSEIRILAETAHSKDRFEATATPCYCKPIFIFS
jgi:hypothetical protein